MSRKPSSAAQGQALAEYLVALLVLTMLFGIAAGDDAVIDSLLTAVQTAFSRLSTFLSLPL